MCALLCSASASVCQTILGVWPQVRPDRLFPESEGAHATEARRTTAELPGGTLSPPVSLLVAAAQPAAEPSPTPIDSQRRADVKGEKEETVRWYTAESRTTPSVADDECAEASRCTYTCSLESIGCALTPVVWSRLVVNGTAGWL